MLEKYKGFLEAGTECGQDYSVFGKKPLGRYHTLERVFSMLKPDSIVVELGTTRSFVHGGLEGCNSDDMRFWTPDSPERWDWGAGCFTRVAAECCPCAVLHTVDLSGAHMSRCRLITAPFAEKIRYHVTDSISFLHGMDGPADLIYLDTGDMTPIEPTALCQLEESKAIVERELVNYHGFVLIDDVRNTTPLKFGEKSLLGKAKYSIPYLLDHGFWIVMDEYQVLMQRIA